MLVEGECVGGLIAMVRRRATQKKKRLENGTFEHFVCQRMNRSMIFIWSNATGKKKKKNICTETTLC